MLGFELYEEVSEELASGKRIWDSAWLDSQKKSGVARSAPAINQVRGACKFEFMCARKRKTVRKDETIWTLENRTWNTGCEFTLAETDSRNIIRRSMKNSHERAVRWIQRNQRLVGGVSWRRDYNIVNNSWSVDAWRTLAGDVVGDAGSQRLVIMGVRMPWKGIWSCE